MIQAPHGGTDHTGLQDPKDTRTRDEDANFEPQERFSVSSETRPQHQTHQGGAPAVTPGTPARCKLHRSHGRHMPSNNCHLGRPCGYATPAGCHPHCRCHCCCGPTPIAPAVVTRPRLGALCTADARLGAGARRGCLLFAVPHADCAGCADLPSARVPPCTADTCLGAFVRHRCHTVAVPYAIAYWLC